MERCPIWEARTGVIRYAAKICLNNAVPKQLRYSEYISLNIICFLNGQGGEVPVAVSRYLTVMNWV